VIGLVVYTGHDTKIIKNSKLTRQKYSEVERLLSWLLFGLVFLLFLLCICQAILGESWSIQQLGKSQYLMLAEETIVEMQTKEDYNAQMLVLGLTRAGRWLLILSNFVPISLIVTVESVRFLQAYFI
jgi:magnesium-transporting ATPase (P-type)